MIARGRIGRELTEDELACAVHYFENGNQWAEYAECAIDCALDDAAGK